MPALYRTYRPRRFSDVVGQSHIVQTLQNAVLSGEVAHAYLFCGGRGLGKTTLARVLARAVNCQNMKKGEPCLECSSCLALDTGSFFDLVEIDAASHTGVDNIRALIETVHFQPAAGAYKVYIIDEAHMLSKGAWNALLKTLEEPPPRTVFILATTESAKVPATISSRAQRFDFHRFTNPELQQQIDQVLKAEKKQLPPAVVALIAKTASGGMRDALTLLDQVLSLGADVSLAQAESLLGVTNTDRLHELLTHIGTGEARALPDFFNSLSAVTFDMLAVNRDLLEFLGELLEAKLLGKEARVDLFSEVDLLFLIRQFLRSYKEIPASPEPLLPLLVASVEAAQKFGSKPQSTGLGAAVLRSAEKSAGGPAVESADRPPVASTFALEPSATQETGQKSAGAAVALDEQEVRERWPEVAAHLKTVNGPLSTLVRNAPICQVSDAVVTIGVRYLFHKEQLETIKNRQLLTEALRVVFGSSARVVAQFVEREPVAEANMGQTIGDALRIFGGELVE